jgi:hypothetical protein
MAQALRRADAKGSPAVLRRVFAALPDDAGKEETR